MNITKIELMNFRNYTKKTFDNFSNLNIIIGKNGIGKTSIIESIYLGSLAKSFKTNNELSIIKEGKDFFRIKVYYFDYGPKKNLEIFLDKSGKKTKINSQPQRKLSNFISQYRIIMLSPDELKLIKSSPNTRRNYLNIQLSQLHKEYMHYLNNYMNLIKNKNDYLKKIEEFSEKSKGIIVTYIFGELKEAITLFHGHSSSREFEGDSGVIITKSKVKK